MRLYKNKKIFFNKTKQKKKSICFKIRNHKIYLLKFLSMNKNKKNKIKNIFQ